MSNTVEAKGLASVQVKPGSDNESVSLILGDTADKYSGFLINPEGLNALLEPLLGLATQWADKPELKIQEFTGPQSALPANHISFERGRNNTESAIRVFVGKVELTFLMPLDSVISAAAQLVAQVDPASGRPAH